MRTVLVTGGAGFLGSHLCERLLGDWRVLCVDNFHTGSRENVEHLLSRDGFVLIEHDITETLAAERVDRIYNLASPASPVHYQRDPLYTLRTNVLGTLNMLELAREQGARFLQASTSEVYGDPLEHPQRESYWGHVNPVGIRSCYDEGKRCAETLTLDYHRQHGVDIRLVRIFNTYGPRMRSDDGRVVTNFIVQALSGADLTVYGEGNQTRSFCYVDDLIEGIVLCMETDTFPGPVNLGNPDEFGIGQLAREVIRLTSGRSRIVSCPLPQDDPRRRRPDIARARSLGWNPEVPLSRGLRRTIAWFRDRSANERSG